MKQFLKKVRSFNNSTEMSVSLFIVKKILAFWVCYIAGLFIIEGIVILLFLQRGCWLRHRQK